MGAMQEIRAESRVDFCARKKGLVGADSFRARQIMMLEQIAESEFHLFAVCRKIICGEMKKQFSA